MIQPIIKQPNYPASRGKASSNSRSRQESAPAEQAFTKAPKQANENFLPSDESLSMLIRGALSSLKKGVTWDRGSIINLNI